MARPVTLLGVLVGVTVGGPLPPAATLVHARIEPYSFADFQRGRPLLFLALAFALVSSSGRSG